jgi:serine/threonine protein phosphatase PrpC
MKIIVFGKTHTGKVRSNNEDNFLILDVAKKKIGDIDDPRFLTGGIFLVVADGMGGAAAGEKASEIVINTAMTIAIENKTGSDADEISYIAIKEAIHECKKFTKRNPEVLGMGSVATYGYIYKKNLFITQVGDTRLYLHRDKELTQITEDQNLVTELLKLRMITPDQAQFHPQKNAVTQAIGATDDLNPISYRVSLKVGDKLLLCSDGLTGMVSDLEIQSIIESSQNNTEAIENLIDTANENGGVDNITVILAEIVK